MGTRGPGTNAPADDTPGRGSTVFLSPLDLRRSAPKVSEPNDESLVPNERDHIPGLHQAINAPRSLSFFYFHFIVPMVLQQPQVVKAGTLLLDLEGGHHHHHHHHHHHPSDEHHSRIIYTIYRPQVTRAVALPLAHLDKLGLLFYNPAIYSIHRPNRLSIIGVLRPSGIFFLRT